MIPEPRLPHLCHSDDHSCIEWPFILWPQNTSAQESTTAAVFCHMKLQLLDPALVIQTLPAWTTIFICQLLQIILSDQCGQLTVSHARLTPVSRPLLSEPPTWNALPESLAEPQSLCFNFHHCTALSLLWAPTTRVGSNRQARSSARHCTAPSHLTHIGAFVVGIAISTS